MKRTLLLLIVCLSLSVVGNAQTKKPTRTAAKKTTTTQTKKTVGSLPKKTIFEFYIYDDATFKKAGENDYYVVNFGKKNAHQLYMDVLSHIASIYKNPDYVTSKVEDRSIVINGYADEIAYYNDWQDYMTSVSFKYRIELQFKDGKIRVNKPTLLDAYTSNALGDSKLSDYPSINSAMFNLFGGQITAMKKEIDKYINRVISSVVYGSRDNDW